MLTAHLNRCGVARFARAAAFVAVGAALGWNSVGTAAEEPAEAARAAEIQATGVKTAALERAFWVCDHAVTTRVVSKAEGVDCGVVAQELKNGKFGGDFERMLDWWRANKVAQHERLHRAGAANEAP